MGQTCCDIRRPLLVTLLGVFIISTLQAQSKATSIATIRKDFTAINADKTLLKKTLSDEEFVGNVPDGGAN